VVALMMGGGFVMTGKITPEQLTKFILYSEWVVHSTWWVGNHWSSLMQAIGASEKVFQLLDLPPSKQLSMHGNLNYQIKAVIHCLTVSWKDLWTAPQTCLNGSSR
jgi:ABC-type multidrug transport system fused ATPase/permease subunit